MQMESPVSLDCDAGLHPENIMIKDGDFCVTASPQNHDLLRPVPNSTKKQTRQWAAWTRQEEESFFTALRQVGKNFEKITCRVQSKNKDQVRHYYYRLVRRMNKLLGPGLCLDAKNSKDTNAAMLRWWSLLEKYSCKASKLHLKPRRFKIFVETLEHQLLKDRKKSKRKQPSQGENCPLSIPTTVSNQGRASGHDTHAVKLVLLDSQNIKKLGPAKGPSVRRNVNVGINRSSCKGDSFPAKTRQRRRPGIASTAAYKRWERAAIAGVSLVADAAEHLERTTTDKEVEHVHCTIGKKGFDPVGKDLPPLPTSSPNSFIENNIQTSTKLKLQLFPIDEGTRRSLEMDNHNPHLELTLSTRKKISSVLEHLNRKWGNSSVASGELMLFPYCVQRENLVGYWRWTHDSVVSAADVYQLIGSPPVFRLRYGWFSNAELASAISQACLVSSSMIRNLNMGGNGTKEQSEDSVLVPTSPIVHQSEKLIDHCNKDQQISEAENVAVVPSSSEMLDEMPDEIVGCIGVDGDNNIPQSFDGAATVSWVRRETDNGAVLREGGNKDRRLRNGPSSSAGEWADSLTNISIGDLLSEVSHEIAANGVDPPIPGSSQCLQQGPFSCDSFDAAIAAHIYRHQNKTSFPPGLASLASSILDAEETCDAFSFQSTVLREELRTTHAIGSSEACKQIGRTCSAGSGATVELTEVEVHMDDKPVDEEPMDENPVDEGTEDGNPANGDLMDDSHSDPPILENSTKDLNGLTDIYWPDSLGPLDLDIPSSRYHTEDLILSDSLSGLNRLLASSLDAFHNCSFFGLDKKEMASTVEAQENCFLPRL